MKDKRVYMCKGGKFEDQRGHFHDPKGDATVSMPRRPYAHFRDVKNFEESVDINRRAGGTTSVFGTATTARTETETVVFLTAGSDEEVDADDSNKKHKAERDGDY
jgi:hypothetical protein